MKQSRRFRAALALVPLAAVAACVVLSVYAQKSADPFAADARAEYDRRLSGYGMTDIYALEAFFSEHQLIFLPIAPPGLAALVQSASPSVVPFDWSNFPKEFNDHLIGEKIHGVPVYLIQVAEDAVTREVVFYNADGEKICALPPPKEYNPYWFAEWMFPGVLAGRYDKETTAYILKTYDPARIQMTVSLVPTEGLYAYLIGEAEEAAALKAQAESLAPGGGSFLLDGEGSNEFAIVDYVRSTNGLEVVFDSDTNCYYKIQQCDDLLEQVWTTTNMLLGATGQVSWVSVPAEGDQFYRFYRVIQAAVTNAGDEDADGMDDVWELQNGLDPLNPADAAADADDDGLSNLQEWSFGTSPLLADTDQDGLSDGEEVTAGLDPLYSPLEHPVTALVFSYDDQDRLGSVTSAVSSISMTYDDAGNISTLSCSKGE